MENGEKLPGQWGLKELYESFEAENLRTIREIHQENAVFQEIRERHQHHEDPRIVLLCVEIISLNLKRIRKLMTEIEYDREQAERFSHV